MRLCVRFKVQNCLFFLTILAITITKPVMEIAGDVMVLGAELAHAVEVIMNPVTTQQSRKEAEEACEK